jgi:hypothetical protein
MATAEFVVPKSIPTLMPWRCASSSFAALNSGDLEGCDIVDILSSVNKLWIRRCTSRVGRDGSSEDAGETARSSSDEADLLFREAVDMFIWDGFDGCGWWQVEEEREVGEKSEKCVFSKTIKFGSGCLKFGSCRSVLRPRPRHNPVAHPIEKTNTVADSRADSPLAEGAPALMFRENVRIADCINLLTDYKV